jgi:hypothetical protein
MQGVTGSSPVGRTIFGFLLCSALFGAAPRDVSAGESNIDESIPYKPQLLKLKHLGWHVVRTRYKYPSATTNQEIKMRQAKNIFIATLILISASAASADCTLRPSSGLFAHTKAPSSVKVAQASSAAVKTAR